MILLAEFKTYFPHITIQSLSADALYGSKKFFKESKKLFPSTQVISQLRCNQKVWFKNKLMTISEAFKLLKQISTTLGIRGGEPEKIIFSSAKIQIKLSE